MPFPDGPPPELPARFRGRPEIDAGLCRSGCTVCAEACPTQAITGGESAQIDLGRCLFCSDCVEACPEDAIFLGHKYELSDYSRDAFIYSKEQLLVPLGTTNTPGIVRGR
jgi:formate hydrogenlyase subunit 6/NADH:ubiquinone oxidoreductase subunit I